MRWPIKDQGSLSSSPFISLLALIHILSAHLFCIPPVHSLSPSCHVFLQSSLSIKRSIDSPDSHHSPFVHCAISQPCLSFLILISISLTRSITHFYSLSLSFWPNLSIHVLSPTEKDRCSRSSCSVARPSTLLTNTGTFAVKCNCVARSLVLLQHTNNIPKTKKLTWWRKRWWHLRVHTNMHPTS